MNAQRAKTALALLLLALAGVIGVRAQGEKEAPKLPAAIPLT
jgi:hypothetical protein